MQNIKKIKDDFEYLSLGNSKEYFQTEDLALATSLVCRKYTLIALDKQNPHKVSFYFRRQVGIEEDIDSHWNGRLEVKSITYFDTLRTLKNRLHAKIDY
jgi:hypothetical protein